MLLADVVDLEHELDAAPRALASCPIDRVFGGQLGGIVQGKANRAAMERRVAAAPLGLTREAEDATVEVERRGQVGDEELEPERFAAKLHSLQPGGDLS